MKAHLVADENRKWWTLGAVAFGLFMIMLDNTVVNVALPTIQKDLHPSQSSLEWIINSYILVFATLILLGGKLGDRFGRKRHAVGTHVGNKPDRLAADFHALVEPLGDAHRGGGAETQLARGFLLQG